MTYQQADNNAEHGLPQPAINECVNLEYDIEIT